MYQFGMRTGPSHGGAGRQLVRKPTRWASSAPEVLKRTCLHCTNEGGADAGSLHQHGVLQGRLALGANRTAE
eukprot:6195427-Alexandrium_andersonii.AAC.1